ncbi:chemotaxis protein [Escherichia coli]|nr:chemotaxis protein [Escherichia coli]EFN9689679.1 chemotaxis protein [Escherichia coli]
MFCCVLLSFHACHLSVVTNGAIVIHTQRLKSDPGGNLLS